MKRKEKICLCKPCERGIFFSFCLWHPAAAALSAELYHRKNKSWDADVPTRPADAHSRRHGRSAGQQAGQQACSVNGPPATARKED